MKYDDIFHRPLRVIIPQMDISPYRVDNSKIDPVLGAQWNPGNGRCAWVAIKTI